MNEKPEALRLADLLDKKWWRWKDNPTDELKAAAELRRLHAENEKLRMTLRVEESCSFRTQMQQYAAQRDELLEALTRIRALPVHADSIRMAHKYAEDAIAKAGGAE